MKVDAWSTRPVLVLFLCASLVSPSRSCLAWGPTTHVLIATKFLDGLEIRPKDPLAFLTRKPYRDIFIRASVAPDMTMNIMAGGKVDLAYNHLFHDRALPNTMIAACQERHDWTGLAFALGWLAHIEADRISFRPEAVVKTNLFDLTKATFQAQSQPLTWINKFTVDVVAIQREKVPSIIPYIDDALLIEAANTVIATQKLKVAPPAEVVSEFHRGFDVSCAALHALCMSVAGNRKALPELTHELLGDPSQNGAIPEVADSVESIETFVVPADGEWPPAIPTAAPGPAPARSPKVRVAQSSGPARSAAVNPEPRSSNELMGNALRQFLVAAAVEYKAAKAEKGSDRDRLLTTFTNEMVKDVRTWPEIREAMRKAIVPSELPGE